jgi:chemotaxis methyl-accepting protein methylase/chemotaxis signal transduction protein
MSHATSAVPADASEFVAFRLGEQEFCIDIMSVREIRGWTPATVLPHAPHYVRGVINLRGSVLPIVDLAQRLSFASTEATQRHVIIVVHVGSQIMGLLVDAVSEILNQSTEAIQPMPEVASDAVKSFLHGILAVDGRMIGLIKLDNILPSTAKPCDELESHPIPGRNLEPCARGVRIRLHGSGLPPYCSDGSCRFRHRPEGIQIGARVLPLGQKAACASPRELSRLLRPHRGRARAGRAARDALGADNQRHPFLPRTASFRTSRVAGPALSPRGGEEGKKVRIWSAACSTGQEPYSIALSLLSVEPGANRLDVKILATDIDPRVLSAGGEGVFPEAMLSDVPPPLRARYFSRAGADRSSWRIADEVKKLISFRALNLNSDWPMRGLFHVIFCRNVVIYFDADAQSALWGRFAAKMEPGGWLYIGHSERVTGPASSSLRGAGVATTYKLAATRIE